MQLHNHTSKGFNRDTHGYWDVCTISKNMQCYPSGQLEHRSLYLPGQEGE
jgi:hypothetical protein